MKGFDIAGAESIGDDFARARAAGFGFGFAKLYQAPYGVDRGFANAWPRMLAAGLTRAPYLFPDYRPGAAPALEQVQAAYVAFVAAGGWADGDMAVGIDIEFPGGRLPQTIAAIVAFLEQFVLAVRQVFGCWGIPYTSARVWDGTDTDALRAPVSWVPTRCPLWEKTGYIRAARQPDPGYVPTGRPKSPAAWAAPLGAGTWVNQYDGDVIGVPGFVATIDENRFLSLSRANATAADAGRINWVAHKLGIAASTVWADTWSEEFDVALRAFQDACRLIADADIGVLTFARLSRIVEAA